MNKKTAIIVAMFLVLLAASCAPRPAAPLPTVTNPTKVVPDPTKAPVAATTEAPASVAATEAPTEAASVDPCISCHTNKEVLVALAVEPEETEGESEGVG